MPTGATPQVRFPEEVARLAVEFLLRREYSKGAQFAVIADHKAQNTPGGTFTSGAWQTRGLNTEVYDPDGIVSVAANQFTLQSGTYFIIARAPASGVDGHQARLQNITAGTTLLVGSVEAVSSSTYDQNQSFIIGGFVLSATTALEIQHRCVTTRATHGFGQAANLTTEVYTQVFIIKTG